MSTFVMTDAVVIVNGVTLSDHATSVTANDNRAQVDATTFGAAAKKTRKGLGDATIEIQFFQDFAAGSVYATLQPLIGSLTDVQVEVRATSAARSVTNPGIVLAACQLFSFQPLTGQVGNMAAFTATFQNTGNAGMTYPTS
jgi:hypothetical protein